MTQTLETLVHNIQQGKEEWDVLYKSEKKRVLNWCGGDEDMSQIAWIKLFTNIQAYDPERPFLTWAKTVVINSVINEAKSRKRKEIATLPEIHKCTDEDAPDVAAEKKELSIIVRECMDTLTNSGNKYSEYLEYYSQGHTLQEIADITDSVLGTVKSQLHYGKLALKKELKRRGIDESSFE